MVGRTNISVLVWSIFFMPVMLQGAQPGVLQPLNDMPAFDDPMQGDPFADSMGDPMAMDNPFIPPLTPAGGQQNQGVQQPAMGGADMGVEMLPPVSQGAKIQSMVPAMGLQQVQPQMGMQQGQMMQGQQQGGQPVKPSMQPFILKDDEEGSETAPSSDSLYAEAQKTYNALYENRDKIRALVDQQENQEKELDDQIGAVARNIGEQGGMIDGISKELQEYIASRSKEVTEALQSSLQKAIADEEKNQLTNIANKINEVSQALIQLGTLRANLDSDYQKIKDLQRKVFDGNQLLRTKRNEYSNIVSAVGQLKSTLMEQNKPEVHQAQVEMMRKKKAEAEAKVAEIQKVQFDFQEENQIRSLIQAIQEKLNTLNQQLETIKSRIQEIKILTEQHATLADNKIVQMLETTREKVSKQPVNVMPGSIPQSEKQSSTGFFGTLVKKVLGSKKLTHWFKSFTTDVKKKITHDSQVVEPEASASVQEPAAQNQSSQSGAVQNQTKQGVQPAGNATQPVQQPVMQSPSIQSEPQMQMPAANPVAQPVQQPAQQQVVNSLIPPAA